MATVNSAACASNKNKTVHRKVFCTTHCILSHPSSHRSIQSSTLSWGNWTSISILSRILFAKAWAPSNNILDIRWLLSWVKSLVICFWRICSTSVLLFHFLIGSKVRFTVKDLDLQCFIQFLSCFLSKDGTKCPSNRSDDKCFSPYWKEFQWVFKPSLIIEEVIMCCNTADFRDFSACLKKRPKFLWIHEFAKEWFDQLHVHFCRQFSTITGMLFHYAFDGLQSEFCKFMTLLDHLIYLVKVRWV